MLFQLLQTNGIILPLMRASDFLDLVKEKLQLFHLSEINLTKVTPFFFYRKHFFLHS